MTNSSEFHLQQFRGLLMSLNTAMPCEVLEYNPNTCRVKLQPKFEVKELGKNPKKLPPIENVPVLIQKFKMHSVSGEVIEMYPHLERGDIVQVVFNQRAIDDALRSGGTVRPGAKRLFSIHDAVVVGVFKQ